MRVGLIGLGRFGKFLGQMLAPDFELLVFNRTAAVADQAGIGRVAPLEEVLSCPVIFYAVSINSFEEVIADHVRYFAAEAGPKLLIDVLSVKLFPKAVFEKYLPGNIQAILTHPMFGPDSVRASGLAGQPLVMDRFTAAAADYRFWKEYFAGKQLKVIEMSADEHDRAAANSQGVTHFIGRVLAEMQMTPTNLDTLGAKKLLEIKEQTCNDSWELFSGLQTKNPYTVEMRVRLGQAVDTVYNKLLPNRVHTDRLVVGIQGGRGSFNEEAARYYLNRAGVQRFELSYLYTTERVLEALHEGRVDRGQFAIHNSAGGVVDESIEAMAKFKFKITEQFSIKIAHALMIRPDADLARVDTIMTHPQVLKQCRVNLQEKYSRLRLTSGEGDLIDHANVAQHLAAGDIPATTATMGSRVLAEIYGLRIVEDNLQDLQNNFTSFLWVERP